MPGRYTVTEEVTNRYETESLTAGEYAVIAGTSVIFDLTEGQCGTAIFVNRKYEQGGFSHSCLVENVIKP